MVTNLCPNAGNNEWCPNPNEINEHGYGAHFDLLDTAQAISNLGWNNPAVTYKFVIVERTQSGGSMHSFN
jgi:hypothetical protein